MQPNVQPNEQPPMYMYNVVRVSEGCNPMGSSVHAWQTLHQLVAKVWVRMKDIFCIQVIFTWTQLTQCTHCAMHPKNMQCKCTNWTGLCTTVRNTNLKAKCKTYTLSKQPSYPGGHRCMLFCFISLSATCTELCIAYIVWHSKYAMLWRRLQSFAVLLRIRALKVL